MTDPRVEKWTRWVKRPMRDEIVRMHQRRDTWQQVQQIIRAHGDLPDSYWWRFMFETYADAQGAAVRRQVYADRDAHSLGRLLLEMSQSPEIVTPAYFASLYRDDDDDAEHWQRLADREWIRHWGGNSRDHLDPSIPSADLEALRRDSAKVTRWADRHIAHSDRRALPAEALPTVDELHSAVEHIGEIFKRYYFLLTATSWLTLVPVIQHDWMAAFRVPWIRPGDEP